MTLGERIRTKREEKGWSLNELARRSGVSPAYLSQLENGKSKELSITKGLAIAAALEVPLTFFTDGKPIEMRCETCLYYDTSQMVGSGAKCRRFPPTPIFYSVENIKPQEREIPVFVASFPKVDGADWCGEWKPKQ